MFGEWATCVRQISRSQVRTRARYRLPSGFIHGLLTKCLGVCRELWPFLIEKAYAKFYGCYEAIERGKVHQGNIEFSPFGRWFLLVRGVCSPYALVSALVDFTNGASEELKLTPEYVASNMDALFQRLQQYQANGYLMGCGRYECSSRILSHVSLSFIVWSVQSSWQRHHHAKRHRSRSRIRYHTGVR
jgi:hypothetical protein